MIRWTLWFFLAPLVFVLEGALAAHLPFLVDLGVAVCLVVALYARVETLPGLLFCAALGRGLVVDGDLPLHFLAMGLPVAFLLPMRRFFDRSALTWQFGAAVFLAITVPRTTVFLGNLSGQGVGVFVTRDPGVLLLTAILLPFVARLARRLPPLSLFVERAA